MDIRVICIGDELLNGDTLNTNLLYVGERLACAGLEIASEACVKDEEGGILGALEASSGADVVLMIGGLGPTRDDMTRPVTAKFLGRKLVLDEAIRDGIEKYLGSGLVKGIGPKFAKLIVSRFGLETFEVIETDADKLLEDR